MSMLIWIKLISLAVSIWFSLVIIGRSIHKSGISAGTFIILAISLTTFLTMQFKLYQ